MHQLWRQSPLVPFLFSLILGIIVSDAFNLDISNVVAIPSLLVFAGGLYLFRNNIYLLHISLIIAFLCGILLVGLHRQTYELPQIKHEYYAKVVSVGRESAKAKNAEIVLFQNISDSSFQLGDQHIAAIFLKNNQNTEYLSVGQIIRFTAQLQPIAPDNSFSISQIRKGILYRGFISSYHTIGSINLPFWERARSWLRTEVLSPQYISRDVLVRGICLGDKSGFDKETIQPYRQAGFMHLLAVSGMHIGIIGTLINLFFGLFAKTYKSKIFAKAFSIALVWLYVAMVGFAPSAVRAAIMFSLYFGFDILENQPSKYNVLALAALTMLIFSPMLIFDIGFQLSYAAMVGIISGLRIYTEYIKQSNWLSKYLSEAFIVGLGAQMGTLPFCLYYFGYYPTYSSVFSVVAGLVVTAIMALVLVAILAYSGGFTGYVGYAIDFFADLLDFTAHFSSQLPFSGLTMKINSFSALAIGLTIMSILIWGEILIHRKKEMLFQ